MSRSPTRWVWFTARWCHAAGWKHPETKWLVVIDFMMFDQVAEHLNGDICTPSMLTIVIRWPRWPWIHIHSDWKIIKQFIGRSPAGVGR